MRSIGKQSDDVAPHGVAAWAEAWARIRAKLRDEVGDVEFRSWLRQMTLAAVEGDEATITLPTRFLRDWVSSHYGDRLRALWQQENSAIRRVDLRVAASARAASGDDVENEAPPLAESLTPPSLSASPMNSPMPARGAWPKNRRCQASIRYFFMVALGLARRI